VTQAFTSAVFQIHVALTPSLTDTSLPDRV
jgi:hypothetical protein